MTTPHDDMTAVLEQVRRGDPGAFDALLAVLYKDLRRVASVSGRDLDRLALDRALMKLAEVDPQLSRVVELHAFGGLSTREIAEAVGISDRSAERAWTTTRTWLRMELGREAVP